MNASALCTKKPVLNLHSKPTTRPSLTINAGVAAAVAGAGGGGGEGEASNDQEQLSTKNKKMSRRMLSVVA